MDLLLHDPEEAARDKAEGERLTYVAATRARDLLVVPTVGDGPYEGGWLDPLNDAIYPPESSRRQPGRAPGCPAFVSKDSVFTRPDGDPATVKTVCPGAHVFDGPPSALDRRSSYSVTWWDSAQSSARRELPIRPAS